MASTKRRTNISLDTKLFKEATAYGKENGISLSALIEQGLRLRLAGPDLTTAVFSAPRAPGPYGKEIPQGMTFMTYLENFAASPIGRDFFERIIAARLEALAPPAESETPPPDTAPPTALTPTADAPTPTPKASSSAPQATVDIPPEVVERLGRFTARQVAEASGMDRPSVTRFRSGSRTRISQANLNRLLAGLEKLEAEE